MPNLTAPTFQKYQKRIWAEAIHETKRYWTEYRIFTFLASPILAAFWPWHEFTWAAFSHLALRACILILCNVGTDLLLQPSPVACTGRYTHAGDDKGQYDLLLERTETISHKDETIKQLRTNIGELEKPRLDPSEEHLQREAQTNLDGLTEREKLILRQVIIHGKIVAGEPLKSIAAILGIDSTDLGTALNKMAKTPLLVYRYYPEKRSEAVWWEIPEGYLPSLRRILLA